MFFNTSIGDLRKQRRQKRIEKKSERLANAKNDKLARRVNLKSIARYSMMPEIMPRVRGLGMHFGHFAYLIALILNSARLIPNGHPVLNARMMGQFGIRDVLALAANNIKWTWKNIDQIAIFASIMTGLILILVQAVLIVLYAFSSTAFANPSAESFFTTPVENVQTDVVLIFLDQVFGANLDVFGAASQPTGTPVYEGLQAILGLYSMATMVIAVIIVLYYILTVIGEAAKTGTPFGQRFNSLWAPIRLVVALGLLVPLGSGLNSAQYITLWMAKMGSGLGTQIWSEFTTHITATGEVVSKPASASTVAFVSRIFLSEVCAASFNQIEEDNVRKITILQSLGNTSQAADFNNTDAMVEAAKNAGMNSVDISWSAKNAGENATDYTCGHITISLADFDLYRDGRLVNQQNRSGTGFWNWVFGGEDLANKIGAVHKDIRAAYITELGNITDAVRPAAELISAYKISVNAKPALGNRDTLAPIPGMLLSAAQSAHDNINLAIQTSYESLTNSNYAKSDAFDEMINRGWGAAGLWYGNIGKINQKYMEAINAAAPTLGTIFNAAEVDRPNTVAQISSFFGGIFGASRFGMGIGATAELESALHTAQNDFAGSILSGVGPDSTLYQDARLESANEGAQSAIATGLLFIIGGSELYDMKNNPDLDPMARLMGAGHAIVTRSMQYFAVGSLFMAAEGASKFVKNPALKFAGEVAGAGAALLFTMASIGLLAGVFLAYIIPLLPFIYFVFAIIGWVLEIFEAIVAMPLWALAHLRIDGDGMPGQAAIGGYQLLLMILLRPALIVMGLIGGYVIFGAAVFFFITLYNSATTIIQQDISGGAPGAVGAFIYTIIFAFLCYNIAIMCFKMIDDVPKGILRWLGAGVQTFGDSRGDPIGGSREMVVGAIAGATVLSSGLKSTGGGLGKAVTRKGMRKEGFDPDDGVTSVRMSGGTPPSSEKPT